MFLLRDTHKLTTKSYLERDNAILACILSLSNTFIFLATTAVGPIFRCSICISLFYIYNSYITFYIVCNLSVYNSFHHSTFQACMCWQLSYLTVTRYKLFVFHLKFRFSTFFIKWQLSVMSEWHWQVLLFAKLSRSVVRGAFRVHGRPPAILPKHCNTYIEV